MTENAALWIPKESGTLTRYYRQGPGHYNLRRVMDMVTPGKPARRKWALFAGDTRIWEVQPDGLLSGAIAAAESWLSGK